MLKFLFPKSSRLLRSRNFRLCAKYGKEQVGQFLHIQIRKTSYPAKKLGLTVSRRYGKAVDRNRFKRLVREAFRLSYHKLPNNIHLNVRPRTSCCPISLNQIQQELLELINVN